MESELREKKTREQMRKRGNKMADDLFKEEQETNHRSLGRFTQPKEWFTPSEAMNVGKLGTSGDAYG